ncbi:hypothetical protein [Roseateles amylovorans]|uniref:Uncharacterized protein n=1 Tax=Roseateles amylovorans TaxID=2978473 RepID=A0ABY6B3V8_9BURK|nr:hypothetical protein [Roseateles amylovorans]UXH79870.1 hypothetical protein N4261_08310 [Roseateles amylovorans]
MRPDRDPPPHEQIYGLDLTEADLQILGGLPFDPARVSPLTLATMDRLLRLGYVERAPDSQAWRLTAKGTMTMTLVSRPGTEDRAPVDDGGRPDPSPRDARGRAS